MTLSSGCFRVSEVACGGWGVGLVGDQADESDWLDLSEQSGRRGSIGSLSRSSWPRLNQSRLTRLRWRGLL